ncbi:MAG: hypothetical protein V7707_12780 [Motiliproteus sp.]
MKLISTTALAKKSTISTKALFNIFVKQKLIIREKDKWALTDLGKEKGGVYKSSSQAGKYIAWPEDIEIESSESKKTEPNLTVEIPAKARLLSTTAIAKKHGMASKDLFSQLFQEKFITRDEGSWELTHKGKKAGGAYKEAADFSYIAWPESLLNEDKASPAEQVDTSKLKTSKMLAQYFDIQEKQITHILAELGWQKSRLKGWAITEQGKAMKGHQVKNTDTGTSCVLWPESIKESSVLMETVDEFKGIKKDKNIVKEDSAGYAEFREKFVAKHRATDGHFVRSKAEMLIDNWLYMAGIVHAYERRLPIEEKLYSDFWIPEGKVYIEYWGNENEPKYLARKKKKQDIYKQYGFNLIELDDKHVQNLDDILPNLLLKYGVQAY